MLTIAAIDIGANAIRMVIANVDNHRHLKVVENRCYRKGGIDRILVSRVGLRDGLLLDMVPVLLNGKKHPPWAKALNTMWRSNRQ